MPTAGLELAAPPDLVRAAAIAPALLGGRMLARHQLRAIRDLSARNPDGTYRYPRAVILWPRQTGKTTTLAVLALARAFEHPDYRATYSAQTGHITSQRMKEWTALARSAWPAITKTRDSDGTERITVLPDPGGTYPGHGYLRSAPPLPGRYRSSSLDLVIIDECQEHPDELGRKLDADIVPTFDTRPRGQWLISGTAGGIDAEYFRRHYRAARDGTPGYLLLELGTPPDTDDATDPAVVAAHHPGIAAGLTTPTRLADARAALGPQRFAREYGNRWDTTTAAGVFPPDSWRACHRPTVDLLDPVALALEVFPDRDRAVLVAAGRSSLDPDARVVDLIAEAELERIVAIAKANADATRAPVVVDPQAPTVTHIPRLRRARVRVEETNFRDVVAASLTLYDRVAAGTLHHTDQPPMAAAALAAQARPAGTRWTFERQAPGGSLMMAAALAAYRVDRALDTPDRAILSA